MALFDSAIFDGAIFDTGAVSVPVGRHPYFVPTPEPSRGEVRVRVRATAVNRADLLQRMGVYPAPPGSPRRGLPIHPSFWPAEAARFRPSARHFRAASMG